MDICSFTETVLILSDFSFNEKKGKHDRATICLIPSSFGATSITLAPLCCAPWCDGINYGKAKTDFTAVVASCWELTPTSSSSQSS